MDEKLYNEIREMREDLIVIKSTMEKFTDTFELKLMQTKDSTEEKIRQTKENLEEKIKVGNHRIQDLEEQNKWLWRTVIGALITAAISAVAYLG